MVCKTCRTAGELLAEHNVYQESDCVPLSTIAEIHEQCEYPANCTCHHQITSVLVTRKG